jgi:hypothetical protein
LTVRHASSSSSSSSSSFLCNLSHTPSTKHLPDLSKDLIAYRHRPRGVYNNI